MPVNQSVPRTITFHPMPPQPGRIVTRVVSQQTDMILSPATPSGDSMTYAQSVRNRYVRREETLEVVDGVSLKQRVTYVDDRSEIEKNGNVERAAGPLMGKTYVIERRTDGRHELRVFEASGVPARLDEESYVTIDYLNFGATGSSDEDLPKGPQSVGNPAPALLHTLVDSLSGRQKTVEDASIALAEIQRSGDLLVGVYRFSLRVTIPSPDAIVTMYLDGRLAVRDVDGEPAELSMQGPIKLAPLAGPSVAPGGGTFRLEEKRTYN